MKALVVLLAWFTSACSIYQSPGRKYLEQNSYAFAGLAAQPNLLGCDALGPESTWLPNSAAEDADLFGLPDDAGALRVRLHAEPEFACAFRFADAAEREARTTDAIELTKVRAAEAQAK